MAQQGGARSTARRTSKFAWGLYQHVAAVLAAFALAALVGDIFDTGWRGFIKTLVGYWADYVRPATKSVTDALVTAPLEWAFGWRFEVPAAVRDYLSVGIIVALSLTRESMREDVLAFWPLARFKRSFTNGTWPLSAALAFWPPAIPLLWPLTVFYCLYGFALSGIVGLLRLRAGRTIRKGFMETPLFMIKILTPLFYLALLLAANHLMPQG